MLIQTGVKLATQPLNPLEDLPCLKEFVKDDLRLRVLHDRKRCGHLGCIVQLSLLDETDETWMEIAFVVGEDIQTAASLFWQAAEFIDSIHDCVPEAALVND